MILKSGDLLESDADVLVQQCNCLTRTSKGLSAAIAQRLGVDPYAQRSGTNVADATSTSQPGSVSLHAVRGRPQQQVACLYAQYAPGSCRRTYASYERVKQERGVEESAALREQWFEACLGALAAQLGPEVRSVAFPHGIGCGLAGGSWPRYCAMLERWAASVPFAVSIVTMPESKTV